LQQQESISRAVAAISDGRSLINQVRGILVLVYRIDAEAAFGVLKWRSQVTNTKLRAFAEQLMSDIRGLEYDGQLPQRATFDHLTPHCARASFQIGDWGKGVLAGLPRDSCPSWPKGST
jgi:hypothetical protein